MARLNEIVDYCDTLLEAAGFDDYCPNGLQVEGAAEVRSLLSGVTASQALLDAAAAQGAHAILVHHGYFWKGEERVLVGIRRARLRTLLANDVSLIAYHLPLDAHPELGNNACLAERLALQVQGVAESGPARRLLWYGRAAGVATLGDFAARVAETLGRRPLLIGDPERALGRIAWCTGAAQGFIEAAHALGADAYLSGEASEQTVHFAREAGIAYIAAGHHATERYGVAALGEHLARRFALSHRFIDIDNPV